jgi:hypothetical protein
LVFSIAVATMAYIVVEGDVFADFPDYFACFKRWPFSLELNYYAWTI